MTHRWLFTAVVAVLVLDGAVVAVVGTSVDNWFVAREFLFALAWLVVGVVAVRVGRPEFGRLVLLLALLFAATLVPGLGLRVGTPLTNGMATVGAVLLPLQTPLAGHVLLAFPRGAVPERLARLALGVGYGLAAAETLVVLTRHRTYPPGMWCEGCARNLLAVEGPWPAPITQVFTAAWIPIAILAGWLLVVRYGRATRRQRRVLRIPYVAMASTVIMFAGLAVVGAVRGGGALFWLPGAVALQALALFAVPVCFLVGLLLDRMATARVAELVTALADDGADVRSALSRGLSDPDLQVAFPLNGALVDLAGQDLTVASGLVMTPVGAGDRQVAVLVHDRTLLDEPELLASATSAAWLALDRARLNALVQAQLREVRSSRARLVAAADEARRRIERDLHDGAQQRLLAAGLALQMLRGRVEVTGVEEELLTEAETEVREAMRELRDLALGIHPAVLTERGLFAALAALAARCPITMHLQGVDPGPLPAAAQAAAYFAVSEAVANVAKHSGTTQCTVHLAVERSLGMLIVEVIDDGVGGADPAGGGLRGLADRLAVVDGTLSISSPHGGGTRIRLEVPCVS